MYDGNVYDTVTLSETNHWTYTWTELPKYSDVAANTEYVYTVKEVDVPAGYIVSYVKKNASGTTVTAEDAGEIHIQHKRVISRLKRSGLATTWQQMIIVQSQSRFIRMVLQQQRL